MFNKTEEVFDMFELIPFDRHMRRMANYDPFRELE